VFQPVLLNCNMQPVRSRRFAAVVFVLIVLASSALVARPYVHGLAFVVRTAEMQGALRRIANADTVAVRERDISIPTRRGPMRGRLYEPDGAHARASLLTSGLHVSAIHHPSLLPLAPHPA